MSRFDGPRWPTLPQELFLRAALLEREPALDAWAEWRKEATLDDDVDNATYQLAPLLYRNLERHSANDPDLGRLKGIYRRTWYTNLQKLHRSRAAFDALTAAGLPSMALKGIALLARHYRDYGVRPMQDIDLLVPYSHAHRATSLLAAAGWHPALAGADTVDWPIRARHGVAFHDAGGNELDLHWHMLEECCAPHDDDSFWAHAESLSFEGIETHAPAPAHLLLNVIVHGARYAPTPSARWLADAYTVTRSGEVDWALLTREARIRHLSLPVFECLSYLKERLDLPVPANILAELATAPRTAIERLDYRAQGSPPTIPWAVTRDLTRYLRLSAAWPLHERFTNAPHYFREHYEVESAWALPVEGAKRIYTRAREARFRVWRPVLPR